MRSMEPTRTSIAKENPQSVKRLEQPALPFSHTPTMAHGLGGAEPELTLRGSPDTVA